MPNATSLAISTGKLVMPDGASYDGSSISIDPQSRLGDGSDSGSGRKSDIYNLVLNLRLIRNSNLKVRDRINFKIKPFHARELQIQFRKFSNTGSGYQWSGTLAGIR